MPSISFAPGDHYHCNEALVERLGELEKALSRSESYMMRVESACILHGDSKDVQ